MKQNGYIPMGMLEKQFRWEQVHLKLYGYLELINPYKSLKPALKELSALQEQQISTVYALAKERQRELKLSRELAVEVYPDMKQTTDELYEREYQLLQEYMSYIRYFLPQNNLARALYARQLEQVNSLARIRKTLSQFNSSDEDSAAIDKGYALERVTTGLKYPTDITFDQEGNLYIAQAGFVYGQKPGEGSIVKIGKEGMIQEIAGGFAAPLTSIKWRDGFFYAAVGGRGKKAPGCGSILRIGKDGSRKVLVNGLRTCGDHFTGEIEFGPDGNLYFTVGTATNSAVVGPDNSWVTNHPHFHDVPARSMVLKESSYLSSNPLAQENREWVQTGVYHPLGSQSCDGEVIDGNLFANGVLYCCRPDGSELRIVADGFRNPFGMKFSPFDGQLYLTDHGSDPRGSRPIGRDWDNFWSVQMTGWHGWPDFFSGLPAELPHFQVENEPQPGFVLKTHPFLAGQPLARFEPHSANMKFDFSTNQAFGYIGQAFIAQFGGIGFSEERSGYKVIRLNPWSGQIRDFIINPGNEGSSQPLPIRPICAKFSPDQKSLYILDFGKMGGSSDSGEGTGSLWKVTRK
jgi:glucose/arabinose dehydrogenase